MNLEKVVAYLEKYANMRSFNILSKTKKITPRILKQEIVTARILGELSAAEKIIQAIIDHKDWDREAIEGEMHIYALELNNLVSEYLNADRKMSVDDLLKLYGYFDKKE